LARLPILIAPDPVLSAKAEKIARIDSDLRRLAGDMLETMYDAPGIGLAAPQVGVGLRLVVTDVADTDEGEEKNPLVLVNPELVWTSEETRPYVEGCLSIPEQTAEVIRPDRVRVAYLDLDGKPREIEADGLLATCLQHELDHLDGILFIDHLTRLKRNMMLRKSTRIKKERGTA
jgi:peptide deformylase